MHEAALAYKKAIIEFRPAAQSSYIYLQQLDFFADSEWQAVAATPTVPDSYKAQSFLAGASILVKCKAIEHEPKRNRRNKDYRLPYPFLFIMNNFREWEFTSFTFHERMDHYPD
jgi:hypothetical protein